MVIKPEKLLDLEKRMEKLDIKEKELIEKFILGSGKGGQKVNKTYSCVYLKHIPTGIEIKCQKDRSREHNRYFARKELCERLEEILFKKESEKQKTIEKIRRQKRRRSKKAKEKILADKAKQSEKKKLRKLPSSENDH